MNTEIEKAIQLRKDGEPEKALELLKKLLLETPDSPELNYQAAWTCDFMGAESAAVPFYEKAIEGGLLGEDLRGTLLGLGSTYRCLGEYEKSMAILDRAVTEFPEDRALKTFRALTMYNLGWSRNAVSDLLVILLDTTKDENINDYEMALRFYSDKLDETWTD